MLLQVGLAAEAVVGQPSYRVKHEVSRLIVGSLWTDTHHTVVGALAALGSMPAKRIKPGPSGEGPTT